MLNVLSESCLESDNARLYVDPSQGVFPLILGVKINSFEVSRPLLDPPIAEATGMDVRDFVASTLTTGSKYP